MGPSHVLLFALVVQGAPAAEDPLEVALTAFEPSPGAFRAGYGWTPKLPRRALRATVGDDVLVFFDLDGDKRLTAGEDGFALEGIPFVVPLPEVLLLPRGQCTLAFAGRLQELVLTREALELDPELVQDAARLTRLRLRSALPPLVLDEQASADARAHCDYMILNGLDARMGLLVHRQEPGKPGYSAAGRDAGLRGNVGFMGHYANDLWCWWSMAFHAATMLDPGLESFGAGQRDGAAVFLPARRGRFAAAVETPYVRPPDGAIDVPLYFSPAQEIPNPAPGTNGGFGCGFPLFVRLPARLHAAELMRFELLGPDGKPVPAFVSTPHEPASPELAGNKGCAFLVPKRPLQRRQRYDVVFRMQGMKTELTWSFTTAAN